MYINTTIRYNIFLIYLIVVTTPTAIAVTKWVTGEKPPDKKPLVKSPPVKS